EWQHARRDSRALRQSFESRLGPGIAQAFLPDFQFRVAGGRHRRLDRALSGTYPQFSTANSLQLSQLEDRLRRADTGAFGRADVQYSLAVERDARAGDSALAQRSQGRSTTATDGRGRFAGTRLSRSACVRGKPDRPD